MYKNVSCRDKCCTSRYGFQKGGKSPGKIEELLRALEGEEAKITLEWGDEEEVEIEAVEGHLLLVRYDNKFKFLEVKCVCAVSSDCLDLFDNRSTCECRKK